mmetsp:Transcript_3356/g.8680  ORF Transcript_3356/g.8680 Transcript_3356/m.8680 type:complete len:210 (-) Transcript_3356:168-797(-)
MSGASVSPRSRVTMSGGAASRVACVISTRSSPGTRLASAMKPPPWSAMVNSIGTGRVARIARTRFTNSRENSSIFPISSIMHTTRSPEGTPAIRSSTGSANDSKSSKATVYFPTFGLSSPTRARGTRRPYAPAFSSTMSKPTRARRSRSSSVMNPSTWKPRSLQSSTTLRQAVVFPTPGSPVRSTPRMIADEARHSAGLATMQRSRHAA